MKEQDGSIPVDGKGVAEDPNQEKSEKITSTIEDEKQIEKEVLETEEEDNLKKDEETWDGSESEFVEDNDAEDYEEKYAGIKVGYALKKDEIFSCLKHTGMFRANKTRSIVEICLLLVLSLMFFILFFVTSNNLNFILGVISIAFTFLILLLPRFFIGFNASKLTTGKKLSVEIYPDEISVSSNGGSWKIPLNGTIFFEEFNNMFLLYLPKEKLFIIPIRAIEPEVLADVQAMIVAGTTPKEEE